VLPEPFVISQCPNVGAPQGQSQLLRCNTNPLDDPSVTEYDQNRCVTLGGEATVGPTSCTDIDAFASCSSQCTITNAVVECAFGICVTIVPGFCQPPVCTVPAATCTTDVKTVTRNNSALCMKVEPVSL
jgi:hypothetical protein